MLIMGIDPGLAATGFGLITIPDRGTGRAEAKLRAGVLVQPKGRDLVLRLKKLYEETLDLLDLHRPDAVVLEEVYSKYHHPRTAILMAHARGVICLAAGVRRVKLVSYAASAVKRSITGNGNAGKEQIQAAVTTLLGLPDTPDEHVADALALALCHSLRYDRLLPVRSGNHAGQEAKRP